MQISSVKSIDRYETVVCAIDPETGLDAIIAIHNSARGPALGGCRMWAYESPEAALTDVLRLGKGMTYKNALAELPFGGGKSVIVGDPAKDKTPRLMQAMGQFVESLDGRYIIAEDVGTGPGDMAIMRRETAHVAGLEGASGDPSPATAWGVFHGIQAAVKERLGRDDLEGLGVAVQGLGHVGYDLALQLAEAGAKLWVSDINEDAVADAVKAFGAFAVAPDRIYDLDVDVFAPCALGGVVNDETIDRLRCKIVAGSANNQLAEDRHGKALAERDILYAPDFAINAGGVINIYYELGTYDRDTAFAHVARIHDTLLTIFARARQAGIPTNEAADRVAEERFREPAEVAA